MPILEINYAWWFLVMSNWQKSFAVTGYAGGVDKPRFKTLRNRIKVLNKNSSKIWRSYKHQRCLFQFRDNIYSFL